MIKLFASDLDGTLLTVKSFSERYVNQENKQAIYKLVNSQVRFVTASGRHHDYSKELANSFGFPLDAIGSNGATILHNNKCIQHFHVDRKAITKVIDDLYQMGDEHFSFFIANNNYEHVFAKVNAWPHTEFKKLITNDSFGTLLDIPLSQYIHDPNSDDPTKLVIQLRANEDVEKWLKYFREKYSTNFDILTSGEKFIEFMAPGVSKGEGLRYLMRIYGLKENEVACVGDAANDISMFLACDYSYCINTALPNVQKYAKKTVVSVAEAVEDILRINELEQTSKL